MFSFSYTTSTMDSRQQQQHHHHNHHQQLPSSPLSFQTYIIPALPFHRRRQSSTSSAASTAPTYSRHSSTSTATSVSLSANSSSPPAATTSHLSGHTSHISCTVCHADLALTSQIISKGFTGRHGRAFLVAPSANHPLLPTLPNTTLRAPVQRNLVTGLHTVSDVACSLCGAVLGWKYVAAVDEAQRYKVGKFILESKRVCVGSLWEMEDEDDDEEGGWSDDEELEIVGSRDGDSAYSRRRASRRASCMYDYGAGEQGWDIRHERKDSSVGRQPSHSNQSTSLPTTPSQKKALSSSSKPQPVTVFDEEILFDSQDSDECEDLFAGVWSPRLALARRRRKKNKQSMSSVGAALGGGVDGGVSDRIAGVSIGNPAGTQAASMIVNTGAGGWGWG